MEKFYTLLSYVTLLSITVTNLLNKIVANKYHTQLYALLSIFDTNTNMLFEGLLDRFYNWK